VQVVVGADFEARDAVGFFAERGQHQHRNVGFLTQFAQNIEPVQPGKHHVENHRRVAAFEGALQSFAAVQRRIDLISEGFEVIVQQAAEFLVVVDDQKLGWPRLILCVHARAGRSLPNIYAAPRAFKRELNTRL
jgi:hypothetical protein